jgi:hypothetical protein
VREVGKREDPAGGLATGLGGRYRRAGRSRPSAGDATGGRLSGDFWLPVCVNFWVFLDFQNMG